MAELENLLLEAAGRTSSSGKNRHSHSSARRRHGGSYSDGGSDSRGDDFDDGCGYASGKPSGPQIHLKKRLDPTEIDDEQDDRRKLAEMSELQRELILSEGAQKKDDKSLKEKFRPKSADRAAAKDDALNELRAKRLKQQDP
ncbi:hypothetical protein ACFX14_036681 [Malus domestica]